MQFYESREGDIFFHKTLPEFMTEVKQFNKSMRILANQMAASKSTEQTPEDDGLHALIILMFETGDASCPYWEEQILCGAQSSATVKRLFTTIGTQDTPEDEEYGEYVARVLDEYRIPWKWMRGNAVINTAETIII